MIKTALRAASLTALAAGALALGGLTAVPAAAGTAGPDRGAAAASAAIPLAASCPSGATCLWVNANFGGSSLYWVGNDNDFTLDQKLSGCRHVGFNDCASSAFNNGNSCTVYLWTSINYNGGYHSLSLGDFVDDFGSASGPPTGYGDPSFNDAVSSLHWCSPK